MGGDGDRRPLGGEEDDRRREPRCLDLDLDLERLGDLHLLFRCRDLDLDLGEGRVPRRCVLYDLSQLRLLLLLLSLLPLDDDLERDLDLELDEPQREGRAPLPWFEDRDELL